MGSDIVGTMSSSYGVLALLSLLLLLGLWRAGFFRRLLRVVEEMMFSNWQLALLGATAIALSLASGYTTFDGLRNFTSAPLLSFLITFGIQGVMLIVAWLIGESFATGMNQQIPRGKGFSAREAVIGMGLGVALVGLVFYWVLSRYDAVGFSAGAGAVQSFRTDWRRFADVALYFTMALALLGLVVFSFRRGSDISVPYVQSVRLIAKNAVLWVMFLASMTASVFFSFDSHFNAIFPAEQRKRAAEIRTLNQVGGIVADIGERAQKVQIDEAGRLFDTDGWKAYDAQLTRLAAAARGSQAEIEAYFVQRMEERQRGIGEQQERIAGAKRGQTALLRKRDELEAELHRIEPTIGELEAELARAKTTYDETRQAMVAKRIEAAAESGGVEGTGKRGRGPVWRQRVAELEELQRKLSITDGPRLKEAQRRRDVASARIVSLKRELATIVGEVAKYKGEISTAKRRIETVDTGEVEGGRIDPVRVLPAFERARAAFRQQPDTDRLAALQTQCGNLAAAMASTPATKERVRSIDCDPKDAAEAAARLFALNAGLETFRAKCAGGAKLPQAASTDELLSFGRKCLQDSGLNSKESTDLGARLQSIEMNRDDKAHRFVVTWNAFLDGNRLAYLAMVLAIGVDSLVFMAGLFGAAAVKSPLSDVPSPKARSAEQLEAVIDTALLPHPYDNALLVLNAMEPISPREGYTQRVVPQSSDPHGRDVVRRVLNAGAAIGAVRDVDGNAYELRGELFEHLSRVAKREFGADRRHAASAELERVVSVALRPDVGGNADIVLQYVHPATEIETSAPQGFSVEIRLDEVAERHKKIVLNALSAGATAEAVRRRTHAHYLVSADFYKALVSIRARLLPPAAEWRQPPVDRGQLTGEVVGDHSQDRKPIAYNPDAALARSQNGHGNGAGKVNGDGGSGSPHDPEEVRRRFRKELLKALSLPSEALEEQAVASEAMMAAAELKRQAEAHPDFGVALDKIERRAMQTLQQAVRTLGSEIGEDREAQQMLSETRHEIGMIVPALMLLPERKLFDELIEELEDSGDDDLLKRLEMLRDDIGKMDPAHGSEWRSITQQIEQLSSATQ